MLTYPPRASVFFSVFVVCSALSACAPERDCVEAPQGLVVSDIASGKVEANPLPRCKTDWRRPIVGIAKDSDDVSTNIPVAVSPISPTPPLRSDETSTADTPRAAADGNGITGQSGASVPTARDTGASSSSSTATQSTTAAARTGGAVSASAIDDGVGVSISEDENGRLSVTFVGQAD